MPPWNKPNSAEITNSDFGLREPSYANDTASLLVRLSWPNGRRSAPRVVALRACLRERC